MEGRDERDGIVALGRLEFFKGCINKRIHDIDMRDLAAGQVGEGVIAGADVEKRS